MNQCFTKSNILIITILMKIMFNNNKTPKSNIKFKITIYKHKLHINSKKFKKIQII